MAHTKLDIANSALLKLGASPIFSFDDDTKEARHIKLRFQLVKEIVLRKHTWNCATDRVSLAALSTEPAFGWSYQFQLPSNFLRVSDISIEDYKIEGTTLLADDSTIELVYVMDQGEEKLDALCAEAIACYLAWDICYPLTQSASLKNQLFQDYRLAASSAKSVDAQDEPGQAFESEDYLESRINGSRRVDTKLPQRNWPA